MLEVKNHKEAHMAKKVLTSLVDDLDGGIANETVHFGVDGLEFEIDLSKANAKALRQALMVYMEHGRRIGGRKRKGQF